MRGLRCCGAFAGAKYGSRIRRFGAEPRHVVGYRSGAAFADARFRHGPRDGYGRGFHLTGRRLVVDVAQPGGTGHVPPQRDFAHAARAHGEGIDRGNGLVEGKQQIAVRIR